MRQETFKTLRESQSSQFFAWRGFSAKIGKQRGFKSAKAKWYGNKDADYISVGKFKKGGAGKYRTLENLVSLDKCYSDIDSNFPLTWQEIISKCKRHGIPKPNFIVRTSENHYQAVWNIPEIGKDLLGLWECVQEGIFKLFEEFGSDSQAVDAIRYLRNPNKCEIGYYNEVNSTSLSVLYRALKQAGFIEGKPKTKWRTKFSPDFTPMEESRRRLEAFLKENPEYESTYAVLSQRLSIPERTIKYLCSQLRREGRLETQVLGKGKNRKTRFIFKVHIKEYLNTLPSNLSDSKSNKTSNSLFSMALVRAKEEGFSHGVRNSGFFGLALWLKCQRNMASGEIVSELERVLVLTSGFSRREFLKCIWSASRDNYRYSISAKKFEKVFSSLGVN